MRDFLIDLVVCVSVGGTPPEGVIGVGAITYAEYKLMEAQGGV